MQIIMWISNITCISYFPVYRKSGFRLRDRKCPLVFLLLCSLKVILSQVFLSELKTQTISPSALFGAACLNHAANTQLHLCWTARTLTSDPVGVSTDTQLSKPHAAYIHFCLIPNKSVRYFPGDKRHCLTWLHSWFRNIIWAVPTHRHIRFLCHW